MNKLQIGDTIECHDKDDLIDCMKELAREGYDTEFVYPMPPYRLVITGTEE